MSRTINVTIWNEYFHERHSEAIAKVYPDGIHGAIAQKLSEQADFKITTATSDMPEHGLTDEVLNNTDVLIWWGHKKHGDGPKEKLQMTTVAVPEEFYADQEASFIAAALGDPEEHLPYAKEGAECQKIVDAILKSSEEGIIINLD